MLDKIIRAGADPCLYAVHRHTVYSCDSIITWWYCERLKPGFHLSKRNRLRCVRCVWMETGLNASACVGKQPIMIATASTEHPIGCTQRTQRKRLRLDGNRASGCHYFPTGPWLFSQPQSTTALWQYQIIGYCSMTQVGCILSPFCSSLLWITLWESQWDNGRFPFLDLLGSGRLSDLDFADDIAVWVTSTGHHTKHDRLNTNSTKAGLRIILREDKIYVTRPCTISIGQQKGRLYSDYMSII